MNTSDLVREYFGNVSSTFNKFQSALAASSPPEKITGIGTQLVILLISLVLFRIILKRPDKGTNNESGKQRRKVQTLEDIPVDRYFTYRVPKLIEGIATIYQLKHEGVKSLERWAKKHGPIFEVEVLNETAIFIQDPAIIQKILGSTDMSVLNKPKFLYDIFFLEWLKDGLVSSDVETWAVHKKMLSRTVAYKTLPSYLKMMNKHSKTLVSSLASHSTDGLVGGELMYELLYSHSIKIISEIVLGDNSSSETESDDFHLHFRHWKRLGMSRFWNSYNLIPLIWWLNPNRKEYDHHVSEIGKHMDRDIEKCRKELELRKQKMQMFDSGKAVIKEEDVAGIKPFRSLIEEMVEQNCSAKEIRDEVGTFLSAGHETTMVGIQFFMQHLAEHPEIQRKCQEELDALFDSKLGGAGSTAESSDCDYLTMDDLSNLKYLERCILETLRITSVVPIFARQLSEPLQVDGFKFKQGTIVGFLPWAIHRNPVDYPDPDKFDPDRFLPENVKRRSIYAYMPFGQGPRICLGWKLAIIEMKVILAWMLRQFNFHTTDRLEDVKILFEITIFPERNYNVVLKNRVTDKFLQI